MYMLGTFLLNRLILMLFMTPFQLQKLYSVEFDRMIMNGVAWIWREVCVACFDVLCCYSHGET